jgi:hypothetical protein
MFSKITQLLESIKETLEKRNKAIQHSQPIKRVIYRLPSNLQNKDVLSNRGTAVTGPSAIKDIIKPRGDGRATAVPASEHSMVSNAPKAVRDRQNVVKNKKEAEMDKLTSPRQYKKPKRPDATEKGLPTSQTQMAQTTNPGLPKVTAEQSQPKKLTPLGKIAPPTPTAPGDYKFTDPSGKAYGSNELKEEKKNFFRKSLPTADISLTELENGDCYLEVTGSLPLKIESAIKKLGFIPE